MIPFSRFYSFFSNFQSNLFIKQKAVRIESNLFFVFFILVFSPFHSFGEEKVLDLGEIEITGEVRRPNINLIYSKKYINKAVNVIVKDELKKLEKDLLQPNPAIGRRVQKEGK